MRLRLVLPALLLLASCGGEKKSPPPPSPEPTPAPIPEPPTPAEPSPFPAGTLSLKLRRTVGVRLEPFEAAKRIGTIAIDTRVGWTKTARGEGCASTWVQIRPRGWVCAEHLEPLTLLPHGDELPRLERGELVPGTYGKVVEQGATTVILESAKPPAKKGGKAPAKGAPPAKGAAAKGAKAAATAKAGAAKAAPAKAGAPVTSPSQLDGEPATAAVAIATTPAGKLLPGKPVIGSVNVRQYKELVLDGKRYWKISPTENEYLAVTSIHQHKPSEYQGSRLGDETGLTVPLAFVWPRGGGLTAWTRVTARTGNKRQLPRRTVVSILETAYLPAPPGARRSAPAPAAPPPAAAAGPSAAVVAATGTSSRAASNPGGPVSALAGAEAPPTKLGAGLASVTAPPGSPPAAAPPAPSAILLPTLKPFAYRIGPEEWIDATSVRLFTAADPPALLLPGERWIDVDLDAQILVAYEGALPVYATLISAGTRLTPTETGVYRMWKKMAETDMNGLTGEDPYSVATVPWTQFYSPENGLALHTAYWHDGFGTPRSHGCVNLAPADARWLYFWSEPQVPAGWTMAAGVSEAPGSIVRVRSKADPNPPLRGYAKRVDELRASADPE